MQCVRLGRCVASSFILLAATAHAGPFFEGCVIASLGQPKGHTITLLYTRSGAHLRIENADKKATDPINLLDLQKGQLTILFPKDSTYVRIDASRSSSRLEVIPSLPSKLDPEVKIAPAQEIAAFATPYPSNLKHAAPLTELSGAPSTDSRWHPVLTKLEGRRRNFDRPCQAYDVIFDPMRVTIWATKDSGLFPFRLLQRRYSVEHFGLRQPEEEWSHLLRRESLFPMEVRLCLSPSSEERILFKVEKIERKKIEDVGLFEVPDGFREIQAPPF